MCRSVRQRTALASCVHLSGRQTDTTGSGPYAHRRPWQCHPASGTPTPHTVASTGSTSVSCRCHLGRPHRFSILLQFVHVSSISATPPLFYPPTHCILLLLTGSDFNFYLSWTSASTSSLLQHQSSRPTASPTHGRIPFFHVRPPCDTDLSNIKKDVPALRSRSKNKGRASPVPHKPTTRYPGHAHSHVRLHLDNNSILHHQRYLGHPFSSHPHERANACATKGKKGRKDVEGSNRAFCKEIRVHRRRNNGNVNHLYVLRREGRWERDNRTV